MVYLWTALILMLSPAQADDFNIDAYKGKVVYIDFWASWCGPCKESFPWLNKIHQKYKDQGLVVVGINVDKEKSKADEFLKEHPAQFPIFFNADGSLAKKFGVKGMPYSVIIDKKGQVIHSHIGFHADKTSEYSNTLEGALK
jgi:thiol-disulfide isomerase/thioredoxin